MRKSWSRLASWCALSLVVSLSACGGDGAPADDGESQITTGAPPVSSQDLETEATSSVTAPPAEGRTELAFDPCDLLSTAEASAYVGSQVADGERQVLDTDEIKGCVWTDPDTFDAVVIQAFASHRMNPDDFNAEAESGMAAELIDGLGDEAMLVTLSSEDGHETDGDWNSLWVVKNGATIAVYDFGSGFDASKHQEFTDLVNTIVSRMP